MSKYIDKHLQQVESWRNKEREPEHLQPLKNQTKKGNETQQPKIKIKR